MMKMTVVSATDSDTGQGLVSEILGIPMLIRGEPTTLLSNPDMSKSLGFPTLTTMGTFSNLSSASTIFSFLPTLTGGETIFGKFLPEILR
jgi:hypothetical protein